MWDAETRADFCVSVRSFLSLPASETESQRDPGLASRHVREVPCVWGRVLARGHCNPSGEQSTSCNTSRIQNCNTVQRFWSSAPAPHEDSRQALSRAWKCVTKRPKPLAFKMACLAWPLLLSPQEALPCGDFEATSGESETSPPPIAKHPKHLHESPADSRGGARHQKLMFCC